MSDTDPSHQLAMDCERVIKVGENSEEPTPRHGGFIQTGGLEVVSNFAQEFIAFSWPLKAKLPGNGRKPSTSLPVVSSGYKPCSNQVAGSHATGKGGT